jgi:hypothetical protein
VKCRVEGKGEEARPAREFERLTKEDGSLECIDDVPDVSCSYRAGGRREVSSKLLVLCTKNATMMISLVLYVSHPDDGPRTIFRRGLSAKTC